MSRPVASPPPSGSIRGATSRYWPRCTASGRRGHSQRPAPAGHHPARPELPEKRLGGRVFRVGDKVTQIRNNYDKGQNGVFNGTVGVVTSLNLDDQRLTVRTDEDEEVPYDFDELDELAHAYAVTIHRSQGSEYPAVVIPVTTGAWMMLQRNLLYTAVTRAKKLVVLVGSRKAIGQAVRTVSAGRRFTALDHRLSGSLQAGGF